MFSLSSRRYTGAKTKLLDSIDESILKSFDYRERDNLSFFDVFSGTGVVSEYFAKKSELSKIIINDSLSELTSLYQNLQQENPQIIFDTIYNIIDKFKLSNTAKYGYGFYQCNSAKGLSSYNK